MRQENDTIHASKSFNHRRGIPWFYEKTGERPDFVNIKKKPVQNKNGGMFFLLLYNYFLIRCLGILQFPIFIPALKTVQFVI